MTVLNPSRLVRADVLDAAEKWIFAAVFTFFAWRMIEAFVATGSPVTLLYMFDQMVVLVFILLRRAPKELSLRLDDWFVGFAGTLLAVLIGPPTGNPLAPETVVWGFLLLGLAVHLSAKFALRRSFGVVAANRGVKVSGPYRLVRHPMYLGYILSHVGILLAGPNLTNVVLIAAIWAFLVARIVAEERVLLRDAAYQQLCAVTRWRLVPGVY